MINRKLNKYTRKMFNTTDSYKIKFYKQKIAYYRNLQHGGVGDDAPAKIRDMMARAEKQIADVKALHETPGECQSDLKERQTKLQTLQKALEEKNQAIKSKTSELDNAAELFTDSEEKLKAEVESETQFLNKIFGILKQTGGKLTHKQDEFLTEYKQLYDEHEGNKECAEEKRKTDSKIEGVEKEIETQILTLSEIEKDTEEKEKLTAANVQKLKEHRETEMEFLNRILEIGADVEIEKKPATTPADQSGGCGGGMCGIPLPSFGRIH